MNALKLKTALVGGALLAGTVTGTLAAAGPAAASNGVDGQTMTVCTSAPEGLALRSNASPDGPVIEHIENGWHFVVDHHDANGMLYGYSPILNTNGYVDDGHFC